jgi:hypothetical protein
MALWKKLLARLVLNLTGSGITRARQGSNLWSNPDFVIVEPTFPFNEGTVSERVTYCPGIFIKRVG